MTEENFKLKHLVLDKNATELFERAFVQSRATTQKEAVAIILAQYLENTKEIDLTDLHNPLDMQEIELLNKSKCDKINCNLITELNGVNTELSIVNSDLKQFNTKLNTELTNVKEQLNISYNSIKIMDLDNRLSNLQKIALDMVSKSETAKQGKNIDALQVLINMFTDHVFKHKIQFFDKPNSDDVNYLYKEGKNVQA